MTGFKLPKYKDLADYLGVSEQAIKQYPKIKRELMLIGLKYKKYWESIKSKEAKNEKEDSMDR